MKQVVIRGGGAAVVDVPAPQVGSRNVLVRVAYSCISVGTEMASVNTSAMPLYKRALKQPENVRRVLDMMRTQGVARTLSRVQDQLSAGTPSGYSAAGTVIAVGSEVEGFAVGDRVACAGAGIANHAEVIDVPVNLAVPVPAHLGLDVASTVTLGAIAMQGVRRANPTLGETFVVVGLGVLGQITAQILAANGCTVIGTDLDPRRIGIARAAGLHTGIDVSTENYVDQVTRMTDGMGADGVIVTAASASDAVIREAMQACRKKGRVVLVGDVGLQLKRADFYQKELDFLISASYGPGRYDPMYEEGGQDYPLPYVRWTENRNMQAYVQLLASGRVNLAGMCSTPFEVDRAADAYASLKSDGAADKPLIPILAYPERNDTDRRVVRLEGRPQAPAGRIRVGLVGASSFAQGIHLPNMESLSGDYALRAVMSRTGTTARAVATRYKANYCTSDVDEVLNDPDIDLVMITTRHDLHGSLTLRALRAGKHVFVEKPLTIDPSDLDEIEAFYRSNPGGPLLMVGYTRRFSPGIQTVQQLLKNRTTPLIVDYRMNAGYIPPQHWVHGPEGGGRNLGEACHIYDLFASLTGASVQDVSAYSVDPGARQWKRNDNFVAVVKYADGSICKLTYTAMGDKAYPKERMEVFADGKVVVMDDYKSVSVHGTKQKGWSANAGQKGQLEELRALAASMRAGAPWPIPLEQLLQTSRVSFDIERQISPAWATRAETPED
jgi:predicted dehydrogenase/threonine dehydrogenase-like Zn-dependent dehydrogenase